MPFHTKPGRRLAGEAVAIAEVVQPIAYPDRIIDHDERL
jgi:hypothetical protein